MMGLDLTIPQSSSSSSSLSEATISIIIMQILLFISAAFYLGLMTYSVISIVRLIYSARKKPKKDGKEENLLPEEEKNKGTTRVYIKKIIIIFSLSFIFLFYFILFFYLFCLNRVEQFGLHGLMDSYLLVQQYELYISFLMVFYGMKLNTILILFFMMMKGCCGILVPLCFCVYILLCWGK